MSLLSIPSVTKGESAVVTLNKSELFSLSAVSSDSTFSVQANVKKCIVEYVSSPGNQKKVLQFDLSQSSPSASLLLSLKARDAFNIDRLILEDFDGGTLVVERSQLPSGLDVVLLPPVDVNTTFLTHFDGNAIDAATGMSPSYTISAPVYSLGKINQAFDSGAVGSENILRYNTVEQCNFGINDFTIEAWVKRNDANGTTFLSYGQGSISGSWEVRIEGHSNIKLVAITNGASPNLSTGNIRSGSQPALATDAFTHIALVRSGGQLRVFVDGVYTSLVSISPSFSIGSSNKALEVGGKTASNNSISSTFLGKIDEVRVSKTARYASSFTPPILPLT